MKATASFLGTGWAFPPTFKKGPDAAAMVSEEDDIRQSLVILLSTTPGERFLEPTYGCDLRRLLFEPIDAALVAYVADLIRTAVLYHEPRVVPKEVTIDDSGYIEGRLLIELDYLVRATNTRSNLVYPFYLNEATDIA